MAIQRPVSVERIMLNAPVYPPAARFDEPVAVKVPHGVSSVSLAEIMSVPAAWAIVLRHAPVMKLVVGGPQIQPFLTNMMIESFITYGGIVTPAQVAAIDADFRQLPASTWGAL
jgi:hypothetical protein